MRPLRIGLIGPGFMGRVHSHAWQTVARVFPVDLQPELAVLCGRDATTRTAAEQWGWGSWATDWREVVSRADVDVVDICTPGDTHAEIALEALRAGKHVLCEKPLCNSVDDARALADAAAPAALKGQRSMVGFNYRRVPALGLARELIAEGRLGSVRQVRATYLQDWLHDPSTPMSWRLDTNRSGSGALGDIGSHVIDLAQHLLGAPIEQVTALASTFTTSRPLSGTNVPAAVSVDDAVLFLARFSGGAIGSFEATRVAAGRRNALRIEVNCARGSLAFDLERLNELEVYDDSTGRRTAGFRRILATDREHPWLSAWWPPGHVLGWEHTFIHQAKDFVDAVADGRELRASFEDGFAVQRVIGAVLASTETGHWVEVSPT